MRTNGFRGRRIDNGEWIRGGLITWGQRTYIVISMQVSVTIEADGNRVISQSTVVGIWDVYIAINIAEQEAEERMREKAHKIIKEMMEGVFKAICPNI